MLTGFENSIVKDSFRYLDYPSVDIHHEISVVNDNITSISEILTGLEGTHVKEYLRELRFQICDLRDEITQRMTACERKIEKYDNILADILSRLTVAGI
jgi:hypothetical protein